MAQPLLLSPPEIYQLQCNENLVRRMQMINGGDTAFILVSSALVMFMTPGLALFYGGMVRSKNVLATIAVGMGALWILQALG